jgi:RNase P/RNase MRP subunit POP5
LRAGNIYQFKNLSKFKSVTEFNDHKERSLQHHPDLFTRSEFIAFEVLSQYSVRVPGVANAKIDTLVTACTGKQGGVSRATFVRMLRKAKETGILKVHKTFRSSGGFAHNVFVFQPFDSTHETEMTQRKNSKHLVRVSRKPIILSRKLKSSSQI